MARRDGSRAFAPEAEPSCCRQRRAAVVPVMLADGRELFERAAERWPTPQWMVELDPWQLTPPWPR
jgi:hypothetical protein